MPTDHAADRLALDLAASTYALLSPEAARLVVDCSENEDRLDDLSTLDLAELEAAGLVERADGCWRWTPVGVDVVSLVRDHGRDC